MWYYTIYCALLCENLVLSTKVFSYDLPGKTNALLVQGKLYDRYDKTN